MRVGIVRETKKDEYRVAMPPAGVHELVIDGHEVMVEAGAGEGSRTLDAEYKEAGASVVAEAAAVWESTDLICKVKEPQEAEFGYLREDMILFTFLHLAAYPRVAAALQEAGTTAVGYETVQTSDGSLPLLAPMSEVAGRMAPQVGARFLERYGGGRGILLGGVPGVAPAKVVIFGAGNAGSNAARIAHGMGADVTVFDLAVAPLRVIDHEYSGNVRTQVSSKLDTERAVAEADLVIGAVLLPGAKAPQVVSREMVPTMKPGAVLVDISIDQGGCFETSHETEHSDPVYVIDDVVHYAVGNIPGAVPRTSTFALANVTLPYLRSLARNGVDGAIEERPELSGGLNIREGRIVHQAVAEALGA